MEIRTVLTIEVDDEDGDPVEKVKHRKRRVEEHIRSD